MHRTLSVIAIVVITVISQSSTLAAEDPKGGDAGQLDRATAEKLYGKSPYSPYADRNFPARPLFGDTHRHTFYEATQTKGDGEAHPFLSPNDEFAGFETWDKGNLDGSVKKENSMLAGEYALSGLKTGLQLEKKLGTNPYKFGLIGSSDAHSGLAAMAEDNFFGMTMPQEPNPERSQATFIDNQKTGIQVMDWEVGAAGYAAVWAQENTREPIWYSPAS